jgi:hypothetical protein
MNDLAKRIIENRKYGNHSETYKKLQTKIKTARNNIDTVQKEANGILSDEQVRIMREAKALLDELHNAFTHAKEIKQREEKAEVERQQKRGKDTFKHLCKHFGFDIKHMDLYQNRYWGSSARVVSGISIPEQARLYIALVEQNSLNSEPERAYLNTREDSKLADYIADKFVDEVERFCRYEAFSKDNLEVSLAIKYEQMERVMYSGELNRQIEEITKRLTAQRLREANPNAGKTTPAQLQRIGG